MSVEEKKELLKVDNESDFCDFLLKYHPEYDDIPMNEWNEEIYQYFLTNVLKTTEEMLKFMEENIIEYNQIGIE